MLVKNCTTVANIGNNDTVLQNGLHSKVRINLCLLSISVNCEQTYITYKFVLGRSRGC